MSDRGNKLCKYLRLGPYIVCLENVHGVMNLKTNSQDLPYQIYITYADKTSVVLDMPNLDECDRACDKIAEVLGAF